MELDCLNKLVNAIGYNTIMIIKDLSVFISGGLIVGIFVLIRVGRIIRCTTRIETLDKAIIFSIVDNGTKEEIHFTNPKTDQESIYIIFNLIFKRHYAKKRYRARNEKNVRFIIHFLFAVLIISSIIALVLNAITILPIDHHYEVYWRWSR